MLKEASKITPLSNVFNDTKLWVALTAPAWLYNDNIVTKLFVNFQLYHKSIVNLGTEQHEKYRLNCENIVDIGCFALTELGHGSNAIGILTTAHFSKKT